MALAVTNVDAPPGLKKSVCPGSRLSYWVKVASILDKVGIVCGDTIQPGLDQEDWFRKVVVLPESDLNGWARAPEGHLGRACRLGPRTRSTEFFRPIKPDLMHKNTRIPRIFF